MGRTYRTLLKRMMLYIGMFLIFVALQGNNNHVEAAEYVINVLDYGACGTDSESDRDAMNEALKAAGMASEGETEVYVPPGVYYIDGYLGIYSGTWLHLSDEAKIVRMEGYETESMLIGVHTNAAGEICWKGCTHTGYTQCVNVLVSGGEWCGGVSEEETRCNEPSLEVMSFRHAQGIEIRDTSIGDTDGNHVINLDGVNGVYIENVFFHDHMVNETCGASEEDLKGHEVIHTDYISADHEYTSAYPIEDLACCDVHVRNCRFSNCVSCIGTHNGFDGLYLNGFEVSGCEFEGVLFHCINAVRFQDFEVRDNSATDVSCFISCYGCIGDNSIRSNTISCQSFIQKESCIDICQGTHVSVNDNTIDHAGTHSISGANFGDDSMGDCAVTISGNRIKEGGNTGIYVRDGCVASVVNNAISAEGKGTADRTIGIYINLSDRGCKVTSNEIAGYQYGIEACSSRDVEIVDNHVSDADVYGISLYVSSNCSINDCLVENSRIGIQIDQSETLIERNSTRNTEKSLNSINGSTISKSEKEPEKSNEESSKRYGRTNNTASNGAKSKSKSEAAPAEQKVAAVPIYRVFNRRTGEHFYTQSRFERDYLVKHGWNDEGVGWYAPQNSKTPVYRLYNPNSGEHHYTCSQIEKNWLVKLGWRYEGIGWYSDDRKQVAVYRHYHPIQRTGNHHYSISKGESSHIVSYEGWKYEGIGWYGMLTN